MSAVRQDLTRTTLAVVCIFLLIVASLWVLRPFLAATVWATMLVVATWPMLKSLEARFGNRRSPAVAVMTVGMLLLLVLPLWGAIETIVDHADHFAHHLAQIPVLLLVLARLADVHPTDHQLGRLSVVGGASIYPAVQNVLLAARNLGLGSALTTLHAAVEPQLKPLFGIPEDISVVAMVTLGWPAQEFPRQLTRRPLSERVFADTYGATLEGL